MKQFIVLETIAGNLVAIRPSSIIFIGETDRERSMIVVKTNTDKWGISPEKHSVRSIVKEIEE